MVVPAALDLQDGDDRPLSAISLASSSAAIAPAVGRPNGVQSHSNRPLSMAKNKTQTLRMAGTSKQRRRKRVQDDNVEVGQRQSLNLEAAAGKQSRDRSNSFASTTASELDSSLQLSQVGIKSFVIPCLTTSEKVTSCCWDVCMDCCSLTWCSTPSRCSSYDNNLYFAYRRDHERFPPLYHPEQCPAFPQEQLGRGVISTIILLITDWHDLNFTLGHENPCVTTTAS